MTDGKKILYDPEASSADRTLPGFIARPSGAPAYHGFLIVPETVTDGWAYGAITLFEADEPQTEGDGFVVAPDGSRAGIVWDEQRWGVYGVRFPYPVSCANDLVLNFRAILPKLKERYAAINKAHA
jgi:hypothetical protein